MTTSTYITPEPSEEVLEEFNPGPVAPLPEGCVIRPLQAGRELSELNWVRAAWKRSNRRFAKEYPAEVYKVGMDKLIGALGLTQRMLVLAAPTSEPGFDTLVGFVCYRQMREGDKAIIVHYIAVKGIYRRQGAARMLLAAAGWKPGMPIIGTHKTGFSGAIKRKLNIHFNDFFIKAGSV